jgi:hypothetical protein
MRRLLLLVTTLSLLLFSGMTSAAATSGSGMFQWNAGGGAICDLGGVCPNVAMASNGDTVTVRADGQFDSASGNASGGGTFQHRNSAGALIGSGTIAVNRLIAFSFYGCASPPFPSNICGGRAALAVQLSGHPAGDPSATLEAEGILLVDCLFGTPPAGAKEGIRLNVKDLINFNKSVSGDTLFIKTS